MSSAARVLRPKLERRRHADFGSGIMFYDDELDVPGSIGHNKTGRRIALMFDGLVERLGLKFFSDNPIWYLDPDTGMQKAFYGDLVLARTDDPDRVTADDLLLVIEIVSTNDKRRENKDTIRQKRLNQENRVPEFGLLFPELDDTRNMELFRLDDRGVYWEVNPQGDRLVSQAVVGLEFELLPQEKWQHDHKVEVCYQGERLLGREEQKALLEKQGAMLEKQGAMLEKQGALLEKQGAVLEKKDARILELEAELERLRERNPEH